MPENNQSQENPIYKFMMSNNLTKLDEKAFLDTYSKPDKAKEIYSFMVSNKLTDLDESKFYDSYLKKKDQGVLPSVSSPTQSLSPDFEKGKAFAEKGFLMQAEGTKSPKEQETLEKQGLFLNTVSALDKGFAKNFISSPVKGLGTILQGATKKVMGGTGEGFISDNLIKLGDYLNKAIDELTPQDEEFKGTLTDQVAQALGQVGSLVVTGGLTGAAGKGATLVSQAPKGAALTASKTLGSQLSSPTAVSAGLSMGQAEFDRAKQAGATDDQAYEVFYKNAAVGSVLETIPVMQFFKRFNNSTGGSVTNYIKTKGVAGLTGGIEEMTTEVMQQLYSNKTAKDIYNINQDILDGVGSSGGIGFGIGFLLNAMGANAKILRKQGKVQEADVLENQVKQYEDNLENPKVTSGNKVSAKDIVTQGPEIGTQKAVQNLDRDLANNVITPEQYQEGIVFAEKAAQVADKIPETVIGESRVKSVELLVERNDIKQANDNLIQQKQTTDEAYHAGIDEEIKANEEKIKKVDAEVYNIAKKPSKDFGDKKYTVDGEEVSKEAFEALQGKPIGTKTIIKAEVKPEEVKVTEEVKPTEIKEEVKVKAPTKELVEGESVEFKTPEGNKILGEKVVIPGYEDIDLVLVKDGFENKIYELASGIEMGGTQEAFSKEAAIESLRNKLEEKKITSNKVLNVIFKGENVKQINSSKKFEFYSEERKAREKSDYESLPLKFNPKEIERLQELKKKAVEYGIDKKVKEIEDAILSRAKEGTFKPNTEYFEKILQADIDRKIKKESEQNKVPYPKEYIQKFPDVTEDYLKTMVNSGYKIDKFAKIPSDVKKIMVNGLQLNRDFVNKYGYHPYEQSDNFFTKLLYFMNSLGARENKDARAITAKKELVSALDDLNKVYEKEFGKKAEAEVKPKAKEEQIEEPEVLAKDELKKAEAKFAAAEDKFKKAINKIESTQVKQTGIFGGEQKGMFAMGGEEAKSTLEPLRKAAKEAKAELDNVRNKIKVQEQAQPELKPIKKEAPKKTYQEAVKEKIEAEKKLTKKIAGEKAGVTRNIIKEANKIEPSDARSVALKYLAGGTLSWEAIDEVAGRVKRAALNTGAREFKSEEARSRDYVAKKGEGESLDEAADSIWNDLSQEIQDKMDTQDVKNALMMAVSEYNSKAEMAQALIDGYKEESVEEQEAAFYEKLAEENKAQIIEAEQKAAETNEKIKEEFKEVIGKASKKAKENAKIEFVDRNFEYLKQKIKIEEKCPF